MKEKPQLVMNASVKGEPIVYRCSACAQIFLLPQGRAPKAAAAQLWAAFNHHVQEKHFDDLDVSSGEARSSSPSEMKTRKLIEAAHRISEEVGQELEAILETGPSDENLTRLHAKIVKAARNRDTAERIYSAIFAALHPP